MRRVAVIWMLGLLACGAPDALHVAVVTSGDAIHVARLAQERVNDAGGINGVPLELHVIDEGRSGRGHGALAIAESLAADSRILAVIGHSGSTTSIVASQVYNARGLLQIAPNSSAPLYRQAGPYSFRLVAGDEAQARFIAAHVQAMTPQPRIAVLYVNNDYGQSLHQVLRAELRRTGASVVYESPYLGGERFTDPQALADGVTSAQPTLLIWLGGPTELTALLPVVRPGLPRLRVLGSDAMGGAPTDSQVVRHLRDGDQFVSHYNSENAVRESRRQGSRLPAGVSDAMSAQGALTYDAVGLVADALTNGTATRIGVRDYLATLGKERPPYRGISGPISFDEHGDAPPSYVLFEISGSGATVVP